MNNTNGLAIAGFCVAIASIFINFLGAVAAVGLVLCCVARSQINASGQGGKGLTTAGIIISIIGVICGLISAFTLASL